MKLPSSDMVSKDRYVSIAESSSTVEDERRVSPGIVLEASELVSSLSEEETDQEASKGKDGRVLVSSQSVLLIDCEAGEGHGTGWEGVLAVNGLKLGRSV
jgi:hypothetical protein